MSTKSGFDAIVNSKRNFSVHKASNVLGWLKGIDPRAQRTKRAREDVSVREISRALKLANWNVQAEPRVTGLRVMPDLVATQGDRILIVEVKTGSSTKEQHRVNQLRNYAEATPGINLRVIEAIEPFGDLELID